MRMMKRGRNKQLSNKQTEPGNFLDLYCSIPEEEEEEDEDKEEEANRPHQEGKTQEQNNNQPQGEEDEKMEQCQTTTHRSKGEESIKAQEAEHRRPEQGPEQETAGQNKLFRKNKRTSRKTRDRKIQSIRPNRRRKMPDATTTETKEATARGRTPQENDPNQQETKGGNKNKPTMNQTHWIER